MGARLEMQTWVSLTQGVKDRPLRKRGSGLGEEGARRAVGQDMADLFQQPPAIGPLQVRQILKPRGWRRGKHHHTGTHIAVMMVMAVAAMRCDVMVMIGIVIVMMLAGRVMIVVKGKVGEQHMLMVGTGSGMLNRRHDACGGGLDEHHHQRRA